MFQNKKLQANLKRDSQASSRLFSSLSTGSDVADFLEIPYGQLLYLLYKLDDKIKYTSFLIPKKTGGYREISKPSKGIEILQKKLKPYLVQYYRVKAPVHGFVEGRSIVTNASMHLKKNFVLNNDLTDFYGTINFGRVRGVFLAKPFSFGEKAATVLAQLVCYKKVLPQGASTSPVISNLVAANLDKRLIAIAKKYHCQYTRYADDITFSCSKKTFPHSLLIFDGQNPITGTLEVGNVLEEAIKSSGFDINYKKVRLQIKSCRQEVTGVTVNEFLNVKRAYIRNIRAMIHDWKTNGLVEAEKKYGLKHPEKLALISKSKNDGEYFRAVLYGKLSYLKMVRSHSGKSDSVVSNFAKKLGDIDLNPPKFIKEIITLSDTYDIFIGHASEDKVSVATPIYEACVAKGLTPFIDNVHIDWGDSIVAVINNALGKSKYFLAVMSETSIDKLWPVQELQSAIAREISNEQKVLPLIVGNAEIILKKFPLLKDKLYVTWEGDAHAVADDLEKIIRKNSAEK